MILVVTLEKTTPMEAQETHFPVDPVACGLEGHGRGDRFGGSDIWRRSALNTRMRKLITVCDLAIVGAALIGASAPWTAAADTNNETPAPEFHALRVKSVVKYRCYGGYGEKKVKDTRTGFLCDNRNYEKTLIDKTIRVKIQWEPNPADDRSLAGAWDEKIEFMGRQFTVAMTLFKDVEARRKAMYRLRLLAEDNEPLSRQAVTFTEFPSLRTMNPVTVEYTSRGGLPEEIRYEVTVEPGSEKK
jgi:hypothetical protein